MLGPHLRVIINGDDRRLICYLSACYCLSNFELLVLRSLNVFVKCLNSEGVSSNGTLSQ
jgi:hypothetical protein